jgi:hypothetical protein
MRRPRSLRCGECFAPVDSTATLHVCERVPLSTSRTDTVTWHYLIEPDETDLKFAWYIAVDGVRLLEPCPFCGANAVPPITKVRTDNGMFQTAVRCSQGTRCGADVSSNGYSKAESHAAAVRLWNDRRPYTERRKENNGSVAQAVSKSHSG